MEGEGRVVSLTLVGRCQCSHQCSAIELELAQGDMHIADWASPTPGPASHKRLAVAMGRLVRRTPALEQLPCLCGIDLE